MTVASFSRDKKRPGVLAIWCDDKYDIFGCQIELLFERYNLEFDSYCLFLQQTANCNELHIGKADFELDICGFLLDILMYLSFAGKLSLSSRNNLDYQTISVSSFPPRLE